MVPEKIIVATGNKGKMDEISEIFSEYSLYLVSMRDFWMADIEIDETGETFMENALIKADWVYRHSNHWALADDSGLMVDALGGAPGVKSARYSGVHGNTLANNNLLLENLASVSAENRTARFVCAAALRIDQDTVITVEGECRGVIRSDPDGTEGFGYDPLFVPDGYNCTFAQLNRFEKNRISHRGKAMAQIKEALGEYIR